MRIEAARQAVADLPITPSVLASLREAARLFATHYSTMIGQERFSNRGQELSEKGSCPLFPVLKKVPVPFPRHACADGISDLPVARRGSVA
jgi:hypothetical protein